MDGRIAEAIEYLKEMEQRFAGQPLGKRAASERSRIQHMGKIKPQKEQHRIPENPSPPGQP
jgi:hypothetical protein